MGPDDGARARVPRKVGARLAIDSGSCKPGGGGIVQVRSGEGHPQLLGPETRVTRSPRLIRSITLLKAASARLVARSRAASSRVAKSPSALRPCVHAISAASASSRRADAVAIAGDDAIELGRNGLAGGGHSVDLASSDRGLVFLPAGLAGRIALFAGATTGRSRECLQMGGLLSRARSGLGIEVTQPKPTSARQ